MIEHFDTTLTLSRRGIVLFDASIPNTDKILSIVAFGKCEMPLRFYRTWLRVLVLVLVIIAYYYEFLAPILSVAYVSTYCKSVSLRRSVLRLPDNMLRSVRRVGTS